MPKTAKRSIFSHASPKLLAIVLLSLALVVLFVLELTNTTHIFHKQKSGPTIPSHQETSSNPTTDKTGASGSGNTSQPTQSNSQKQTNSNAELVVPYGTFVSNHMPGKNGTPTLEQSVCNTTPGATCYIQFTKDGITKTLDKQTADSAGAVYWSWDIKTSGLTAGSWKVSAVASLNGQTKTADDDIPLEVQP